MLAGLLHLVLAGVWAITLAAAVRRLIRMSHTPQLTRWDAVLGRRSALNRAWWVLGRSEFWGAVRIDTWRALQVSLMIFAFAYRATIDR
jgi:hypothetical protein